MKRWWVGLLFLGLAGCGDSTTVVPVEKPHAGKTLRVGVLGDPGLVASVRAQAGEWAAETSAELVVSEKPISIDELGGHDVVIFAGELLGTLLDRDLLLDWPEASLRPPTRVLDGETAPTTNSETSNDTPADLFEYNDIVAVDRDQVTKYGSDRYALPIGGSALVLVFQRSALESEQNRAAAKAAGVKLEVPKTWEELDAIVGFLHGRDWSGDGKPDAGIALAWGADTEGVATATYLARATSLGQHRDQYSFLFDTDALGPRLTTPPFVEAMTKHYELSKRGPDKPAGLDILAARQAFREGKVAFLVDRAEAVSQWSGTTPTPVGVAALPGSPRVYDPFRKEWETPSRVNRPSYLPFGGGWLAGVIKSSPNQATAQHYVKYLSGPETTNRLRADRTFPMLAVRNKQLGQGISDPRSAPGVDARGWSDAVSQTVNAVRVVPGLRIPEASGYLSDLTVGRLAVLGGKPPEQALAEVSKAWDARTDRLGRERQLWHYRRSLNSLVTTPDPPARSSQ